MAKNFKILKFGKYDNNQRWARVSDFGKNHEKVVSENFS